MFDRLEATDLRFDELTDEMVQPEVSADYPRLQALAKERAAIEQVVTLYRGWKANTKEIEEARGVLADGDPELSALAKDELDALNARRTELEDALKQALVPRDPRDDRDVIVEIRAGTGGDE